jgi:hypothetical protein
VSRERELEGVVVELRDRVAHRVDQLDAVSARLVAPETPQLGGTNAGMPQEPVNAPCLPVPGIAGVDEQHPVQITREPDAGGKAGGPPTDDGDVERRAAAAPRALRFRFSVSCFAHVEEPGQEGFLVREHRHGVSRRETPAA